MTGHPDSLAAAAQGLLDALGTDRNFVVNIAPGTLRPAVERLRAALAHEQQGAHVGHSVGGDPIVIDVDGCGICGRWVSMHFMVDPASVTQAERDSFHRSNHAIAVPVEAIDCAGCKRYWAADLPADTPEPPACKTCANSGRIGSRSNPEDCPTCGRKPYWLVGDGTYPSPAPATPVGGQPDPDDELLARAETDPISLSDSDVAELARNLRGARTVIAELRGFVESYGRELAETRDERDSYARGIKQQEADIEGLERELTEAREALRFIDRYGCTNYTRGRCLDDSSRSRDAKYGAEQWCDACVAADALMVRPADQGETDAEPL